MITRPAQDSSDREAAILPIASTFSTVYLFCSINYASGDKIHELIVNILQLIKSDVKGHRNRDKEWRIWRNQRMATAGGQRTFGAGRRLWGCYVWNSIVCLFVNSSFKIINWFLHNVFCLYYLISWFALFQLCSIFFFIFLNIRFFIYFFFRTIIAC